MPVSVGHLGISDVIQPLKGLAGYMIILLDGYYNAIWLWHDLAVYSYMGIWVYGPCMVWLYLCHMAICYMTLLLWHGLAVYGYMTIPLLWLLKPYGYAMVWLYMTIGLYGLVAIWLHDCMAMWPWYMAMCLHKYWP